MSEHVKCVRHTHEAKKNETWCGRVPEAFEFTFLGLDHAAYNGAARGRLVACPSCVEKAIKALKSEG